jgi:hypothetical protein
MDDSRPLSPSVVKARRPDVKLIKRCWIQCNLFFFNLLPISSPIQGTFLSLPNQLSFFFFLTHFYLFILEDRKYRIKYWIKLEEEEPKIWVGERKVKVKSHLGF